MMKVKNLLSLTILIFASTGPMQADQALATKSGCMACHTVDTKLVGPAIKEIAAKYKGQAGAVDMLTAKVKAGGVGVWGQVPMPPNAHVPDADIKTSITWMLSH